MARVISVAHDGTGDYRTLQEAIDAVPFSNTHRTIIRLSPGIYKQPVYVPKTKNLITLAGFSPELTVITWNNTANKIDHHQPSRLIGTGTFGCGSAIVEGEDFIAENITFENSAPEGSGQAVAIRVTADRCAFYNCRFLGWQDTLYLHYGKQYLKDCYIEGSVDFIFGNSTALLEHCHIHCKSAGFITAQSRKSSQEATGYVFLRCVITGNGGTAYSYLGRPWGPFGRVVFAHTYMDACIKHHGWHNWGKTENERSACFYEYRCFGPGSCLDKRVTWVRELVDEEAGQFLMHSFIDPNPERPWLAQRMALRDPIPKNVHTPQKISKPDKWETKEDMVLMSAWIFVSEEPARGKNKKKPTFWSRVKERYDATRAENEEGLGIRNENQMKGRFARLNESANKWVVAYRKAYHQKNSGMSMKDLEKEAHAIYEMCGSKINDLFVFNEVMCKHPKWDLQLQHDTTRSRVKYEAGDEESGGSTKRSRTTEGDYSVETNQESPTVGGSTVQRFTGKDATKIKGKVKASQASSIPDYSEEFHALNITRNSEVEILTKRLEFEKEKEHHKTLRILLAKEPLSPGEEELKERLLAMLYG